MTKKPAPKPSASARQIGMTTRSVSGIVPGLGPYESTLERDLMEIIRFEGAFESFLAQPVKIQYPGQGGRKMRTYTPDGLIHFKPSLARKPLLYEVKFRENFREKWRELMPAFRAAKSYCESIGWEFRVFTEVEIRTPFLKNAKFLWPFKELDSDTAMVETLMSKVNDDGITVEALLDQIDEVDRTLFIPPLWNLVANRVIHCDLNHTLSLKSLLWTGSNYP